MKPAEETLRQEFNRWSAAGRGAAMERSHRAMTLRTLDKMDLQPGQTVLDLGCGNGWACRELAPRVAPGAVLGVDVADGMIAEATAAGGPANVRYAQAAAEAIPAAADSFDRVLSVEAFYYCPDQDAVLRELLRVTRPGGRIFLLICIYAEHAAALRWVGELKVPVHVRTIAEYRGLLAAQGWAEAAAEEYLPAEGDTDPHARALLLTANKPGR